MNYLAMRTPQQLDLVRDTALARDHGNVGHLSTAKVGQNVPHSSTAERGENVGHLSTAAAPENVPYLSTAERAENVVHSSTAQDPTAPFKRIERRRKELKIGVDRLCALAGLHPNTYRNVRRGICPPRDGTLDKLTSALRRHAAGEKPTGKVSLCELTIRFLTAYLSEKVGADPVKVLATSFEAENTNDPEWLQSARLRRAAIYIAVEGAKMGKADVGGALGLTRQAVHKAVKDIEAQRDNNEQFDLLMQNALTVAGFK